MTERACLFRLAFLLFCFFFFFLIEQLSFSDSGWGLRCVALSFPSKTLARLAFKGKEESGCSIHFITPWPVSLVVVVHNRKEEEETHADHWDGIEEEWSSLSSDFSRFCFLYNVYAY